MCRKYPLLSLKTLESVHMHCELGKSLSCHFTYRHAYCVTKVSWRRTQNLPFTLWPPLWTMYYSSKCPPVYLKRFLRGKRCEPMRLFIVTNLLQHASAHVVLTTSHWPSSISCSLLLSTAVPLCALSCFPLNSWTAVVRCRGIPDFGIRSECMSAENPCTTYYLVLLFSMWTPALRCGVYLCLCLTLCALHRRSLLCFFHFGSFMMKWLWMSCPF